MIKLMRVLYHMANTASGETAEPFHGVSKLTNKKPPHGVAYLRLSRQVKKRCLIDKYVVQHKQRVIILHILAECLT